MLLSIIVTLPIAILFPNSSQTLHSPLFQFTVDFRCTTCLFIHFCSFLYVSISHINLRNFYPMLFYKMAPFGKLYLTDFASASSCLTILSNYMKLIPKISLSPVHNKENFNISTQRNEIHQHLNNRQPLQEITQTITNKPNNESNTTEEIQNTAAPNGIIFLDDILLITDIQQINT